MSSTFWISLHDITTTELGADKNPGYARAQVVFVGGKWTATFAAATGEWYSGNPIPYFGVCETIDGEAVAIGTINSPSIIHTGTNLGISGEIFNFIGMFSWGK